VQDVSLSVDEAIDAPGQPTRPPLPPRHFMLLFDLSFSDVGSLRRSQLAAREIVSDSVDPKDLVTVTTYSATTGVRSLLNFTSDRAQILAAIDSLGVNQRAGVDALNMTLVEPGELARASRIDAPPPPGPKDTGNNKQGLAMAHLLEIQAMVGLQDKRNRSQQVGNLARDFTGPARLLNSVSARKRYQRNTNQIGEALRNVLLETQVTYMLTFNASKLKQDGSFHKIKVKPTGAAKGAKVSHRPGFYAPDPAGSQRPEQIRLALGQRLMAANEGGAIPTEVLAMPFAMDDERAFGPC
jgi:hypothetical protein